MSRFISVFLSKPRVFVRQGQSAACSGPTNRPTEAQTDAQTAGGGREVGVCFMCACVIAGNLPSAVSMTLVW